MFYSKSENKKIEPVLFPARFLWRKIQITSSLTSDHVDHACLLKYFPKYYKEFSFSRENLTGAIQSKVKRLKVVRCCYFRSDTPDDDEKTLKKLFRTNRKTLKNLPIICKPPCNTETQDFSLCFHFPRVKTLNLQQSKLRYNYFREKFSSDQSTSRKVKKSLGYSWRSCRFVENLKVVFLRDFDLAIIKKIESSKRFLSSLKKVELRIYPGGDYLSLSSWSNENSRNLLMEMMKNKKFLRYVTHLRIENFAPNILDWRLAESLINCCNQLHLLSLSTGNRDRPSASNLSYFSLDLGSLQNLFVLKFEVNHFRTFMNGINFPPFLREITLRFVDHKESDNLKEFFDIQNAMLPDEDQDAKAFESFEKSRTLGEFFEKWKKLENLSILNLEIYAFVDMDIFVKTFILPLLRTVPKLETLNYQFRFQQPQARKAYFDLEIFFSGIESLRSLQHLKLKTDSRPNCFFFGLLQNQKLLCLPNLSSVEIDSNIDSQFNLKQFLNGFLGINNPVKKSLKLPSIFLFCVQDFIRLLKLMHSVSSFKNFQAHLQITLVVKSIDEIFSNFKYPIYVAENTLLAVTIFIRNFESEGLTSDQEQDFQTVFGQLQFTVKKPVVNNYEGDFLDLGPCSQIVLMKSKLTYD